MHHIARNPVSGDPDWMPDEITTWAIRKIDLPRHAYERALAGAEWLDKHAPADWRLQMISIIDGKVSPHVKMQYDTENPAALAFRRCPALRRADGRVAWRNVPPGGKRDNLCVHGRRVPEPSLEENSREPRVA